MIAMTRDIVLYYMARVNVLHYNSAFGHLLQLVSHVRVIVQ